MRQGPGLDQQRICEELLPLLELKEAPQDAARLRAILADAGADCGRERGLGDDVGPTL